MCWPHPSRGTRSCCALDWGLSCPAFSETLDVVVSDGVLRDGKWWATEGVGRGGGGAVWGPLPSGTVSLASSVAASYGAPVGGW